MTASRKRPHTEFTRTPDPAAPTLACPTCGYTLTYRQTVFGGVRTRERWDYLDCSHCGGAFQYRHHTRKLRSVETAHF